MTFEDELSERMILTGTVIYKIITDKEGNQIRELVPLEDLYKHDAEEWLIVESWARKNDSP